MTFVINYRTYISENNKVGAKPLKFRCHKIIILYNIYFMHILILSTKGVSLYIIFIW